MANKQWFILINKQKKGPFTLDQLRSERIDGNVMVWCQGMETWAYANTVDELRSLLPGSKGAKPNAQSAVNYELSALIEVRPDEVDDRTSAIDPAKLRQAKVEAAKIHAQLGLRSKSFYLKVALGLIPVGLGAAVVKGWINPSTAVATIQDKFNQLTHPFIDIPDVSKEDYARLRNAAQSPLQPNGPQIKVALSNQHPVFYIGTNLPEGTSLSFSLYGRPGNIMSERNIEIRVPVVVSKHLAKTPSLHPKNATALPFGQYDVYITEDDEQPTEASQFLARLPENPRVPLSLGKKKKIYAAEPALYGDLNQPQFKDKLQSLRANLRTRGLAEIKRLQTGLDQENLFLNAVAEILPQLKANRRIAKKKWDEFNKKSQLNDRDFSEPGYVYKSDVDALALIKKDIQNVLLTVNKIFQTPKLDESSIAGLLSKDIPALRQKTTDLKTKVDTSARSYADLLFVPSL